MAKVKTAFFCQNCGVQSPKWVGKCPSCGEWNTYVEEVIEKEPTHGAAAVKKEVSSQEAVPLHLDEIEVLQTFRVATPDAEFNRVLGGGIVPGSIVLIAGDPGIGKSTLMLQIALGLETKVMYISGEESAQQISLRARRIGAPNNNIQILTETNTHKIFQHLKKEKPGVVVVDSIQTLQSQYIDSTPGSVSQIRECAAELQRYAKETAVPVIVIGHITKEGSIAGPKILEHIVDTVLQFEGDRNHLYRILRTSKNRFGSTSELGIYEMGNEGLRQVSNPSELLISKSSEVLSGVAIAATIEGQRPMLIETQALVTPAVYGSPQRSATGFDLRRLQMLLAVLEKRSGFQFGNKDIFLNIAGGLRVEDPAIDLGVVSALISSFEDIAIPQTYCFSGEVGLSGEIRPVTRIEQRILEADKLGFEKMFVSSSGLKGLNTKKFNLELIPVNKVQELYQNLF